MRPFVLLFPLVACKREKPTSDGVCVWNQAYQEHFQPDSLSSILDNAQGCYVLVDPAAPKVRDAIPAIHAKGNTVGCYMSVGTCEDWRADYAAMAPYCVAEAWGAWAGEYFVDAVDTGVLAVMEARLDAFAAAGCDWVEFDNMDWAYDAQNRQAYGFSVTEEEAIAYTGALCAQARARGMDCMAKNTARGAEAFAGGTFESFSTEPDWWEHGDLQGYLDAGGLGIVVHYGAWDCDEVFGRYIDMYSANLSFICEDRNHHGYRHYNG